MGQLFTAHKIYREHSRVKVTARIACLVRFEAAGHSTLQTSTDLHPWILGPFHQHVHLPTAYLRRSSRRSGSGGGWRRRRGRFLGNRLFNGRWRWRWRSRFLRNRLLDRRRRRRQRHRSRSFSQPLHDTFITRETAESVSCPVRPQSFIFVCAIHVFFSVCVCARVCVCVCVCVFSHALSSTHSREKKKENSFF